MTPQNDRLHLEVFLNHEGHPTVPRRFKTTDGYSLGWWVNNQRSGKDKLSPERRARLESLTGWVWDAIAEVWEVKFAALLRYVEREGHAVVPLHHKEGEYELGLWLSNCRFSDLGGTATDVEHH